VDRSPEMDPQGWGQAPSDEQVLRADRDRLQDTQHRDHDCGDDENYCCVLKAQKLLGLK